MATPAIYTGRGAAAYKDVTISNYVATIAAGETTSDVVDCQAMRLQAVVLPATFTSANLTFKFSMTPNGTLYPLYLADGSNPISLLTLNTCAASECILLSPSWFNGIRYVQVVSSASQTSGAVINFILNPLYQGIHG